jgi:hypothetical protein
VLVTKHGVAGNRTVAAKSASPTATDTVTLLNITLFNSTISDAGRIATLCHFVHGSNRRFEFQKSGLLFIRTHDEPLSIGAVRVCNPDRPPPGVNR